MNFPELEEIRQKLRFLGEPLNSNMDDGVRVEHRDMGLRWVDNLEKKLADLDKADHAD
ncbi:MAG TPA: hypothetical protein VGQ95_04575 [Chthoniobacterales bacterium]|nr:hypothetical protein [Chthoniobacterales bacterium]